MVLSHGALPLNRLKQAFSADDNWVSSTQRIVMKARKVVLRIVLAALVLYGPAQLASANRSSRTCKRNCPTPTSSTTTTTAPSSSDSTTTSDPSTSTTLAPITTTTAAPTTTTAPPAPVGASSSSIYWGAWMEGTQSYSYYFGGSWGNVPWDYNTWDRFEQDAGKRASLVHYGQPPPWQQAFLPSVGDLVTSRGAIPFMDMSSQSASLTDIANGVYDSSIRAWAQAVKTWNKSFFLRWDWEMNGTWFPWGAQAAANPAAYVASWRHFHDVVASVGASNVTWVWCPNTEYSGSTSLSSLYPGDGYVDWTCVDGYNWGPLGGGWQTFDQVFQGTYNSLLATAPSKPIMIGETSSVEDGGSKASWITDGLAELPTKFPAIRAISWFNWRIYERSTWVSWPIESSSTAQAAFASAIQSPVFTTNTFGQQTSTPIAPPR